MPQLVGGVMVILALLLARPARADPEGTCIELHCYCDGPDQPDTVASCDTTCEDVCGGSSGAAAAATRAAHLAKWSLTSLVGPSYTSHDVSNASTVPDGGSIGVALDARFGRDSFGIIIRFALTSTPIEAAAVGLARERAVVFEWFDAGFELSPRVAGGRRWELRPTAAVWFSSLALLGCDGCAAAAAGGHTDAYGDVGWAARAGFDLYLGARKRRGVSLAAIFSRTQVGDLGANTATEHVAPTVMVQLGLTSLTPR